jgi:methyl-accepting chemotaxis protein
VDQAGATMTEVVTAIRRVTDIMGEISAASTEQSQGVAQVGEAVTQMDQATQQNAALVEQSAAAAESLKAQARQLVQAVAVFRLAHGANSQDVPTPVDRVAQKPAGKTFPAVERRGPDRSKKVTRIASTKPAAAPRAEPPELTAQAATRKPAAAAEGGDDDWTTF